MLTSISVIVPNYNGREILGNCLDSLFNHDRTPDQVVVVDNGSSDGSTESVRSNFPKVRLVELSTNTGFTGANNAGIQAADGELIVLLNNDCVVEPGWLASLEKRMNDSSVGAATSSMRNIADLAVMDSAGGEIDWMGFSRDIGKGSPSTDFQRPMELPFPCGGAVMIRRSALPDGTKLFWDELFIYQEDLDLGFELLRRGWKVVYEPEAVVRHMHSATTGRGSFFKEQLCIRNRLLVLRKHFDLETFSKLQPVIKKWQGYWAAVSLLRGRTTLFRAIIKGTSRGLSMKVPSFVSGTSLNEVFANHATFFEPVNPVKRKLYRRAKEIIMNGIPGEKPF